MSNLFWEYKFGSALPEGAGDGGVLIRPKC